MKTSTLPGQSQPKIPNYADRTPQYYIDKMEPELRASFTTQQLQAIFNVLDEAIPKPSPKIVDLRFLVDLIVTRFYVVLLVGKDRRRKPRRYIPKGVAKVGNVIAAIILLLGVNLLLSASLFLFAYLLKSLVGIDFFSGDRHLPDIIKSIFQ
ncbi:MAG: hypothetical protein RIB93_22820 [Coleofasciculus sp. D1-CHI-01]|uniref:hypothetical protein n=1 Tax=Coleofasciculus sp. D1-CHI-01 TaxID=3068482 RepID=UPI0032F1CB96